MLSKSNTKSRRPMTGDAVLYALKGEARKLREDARARGEEIPHSASLEQLAQLKGFKDWNALCAITLRHAAGGSEPLGLSGVDVAERKREILNGLNGGFMMGARRFADVFARDGWGLIDALEQELKRGTDADRAQAHELLFNELHHKGVLGVFKTSQQALQERLRDFSGAATRHEEVQRGLEEARQGWDADAEKLREVLKEAGHWVEDRRISELRASGWPAMRTPLLPSWVAVPLLNLSSPQTYRGRAGMQQCVDIIMDAISKDLMSGRGSVEVSLTELMSSLKKVDHQQSVWEEAESNLAAAKNSWVQAEASYNSQRSELAAALEVLSESSRWELLCIVFPESVTRAKTSCVGGYDFRWAPK